MSMETLQKAAHAAGYAMAAPDDEINDEPTNRAVLSRPQNQAVSIRSAPSSTAADTIALATTWIRGYLPSMFGGRATA